jgi:hypothetical protein
MYRTTGGIFACSIDETRDGGLFVVRSVETRDKVTVRRLIYALKPMPKVKKRGLERFR